MDGDSLIWVTCWFDLIKNDIWEHQKFLFFSYLRFILLAWSLLLVRPLLILSNFLSSLYFFCIPSTLLAVYTPWSPFLLSFHLLNWTEQNYSLLYSSAALYSTLLYSTLHYSNCSGCLSFWRNRVKYFITVSSFAVSLTILITSATDIVIPPWVADRFKVVLLGTDNRLSLYAYEEEQKSRRIC